MSSKNPKTFYNSLNKLLIKKVNDFFWVQQISFMNLEKCILIQNLSLFI